MTPQAATQSHGGNAKTFSDLVALADTLGKAAGQGKDTQVKFALALVEGGYLGAVDLKDDKHAIGIDDATKLAEHYVRAQGSTTVFDAKAPNQRKLCSTLRTCIKLGSWPKGGQGEPLGTVNNLMDIRRKLRADPTQAKKLDDAMNTLLRYARTQIKRDLLIDDKELRTFCFKPDPNLRTAEQIIADCEKTLRALIDGKASQGTAQDTSPEVKKAAQLLRDRRVQLIKKRGGDKK